MHRNGPASCDEKYFVYTGNTRWGTQNLEYDPVTNYMFVTVYQGKKPQFPNYPMFAIDMTKESQCNDLKGLDMKGSEIFLAKTGEYHEASGVYGYNFPYGSTGIISLHDGYYYFSQNYQRETGFGSNIKLYKFDANTGFNEV